MDEKDRHSTVRRSNDQPRQTTVGTDASQPTTLWRMRSGTLDNEASCMVTEDRNGCEVLVLFTKGLGVPERFPDVADAIRHSMEIAGRLTAQGWTDVDLLDG